MILVDEQATREVGRSLARQIRAGDVITLAGSLAAGKTTLVRGLLEAMGHRGEVPSPSFAIVQPYDELSPPVWHVDLYRIEQASDLDELGLDEIRAHGILLVEWPERAGLDAWSDALALSLEPANDGGRALTARVPPSWEGRWPPR